MHRRRAAALLLLTLAAFSPARAQKAKAPVPAPPPLSGVLEHLQWDPARRGGALLVVDPAGTPALPGASLPPGPPPRTGYRLAAVAPAYGRKAVRVGAALTVLAPETMVTLHPDPPEEPDWLRGTPRATRLRMLLASLTPPQWRLLCGARGLGAGDVSGEQVGLFRSILPQPLHVRRVRTNEFGREVSTVSARDLGEKERAGVRLRLNWTFTLGMPLVGSSGSGASVFAGDLPPNAEALVTGEAQGPDPTIQPQDADPFYDPNYGAEVRREVPNRRKPGHLDFDAPALNAPVTLADGQTLGEWVRAAGAAARLELHADRRVAALPVSVVGGGRTAVRAGDLLHALCLGVTGTFRRIDPDDGTPPLYVLTHDVEGVASVRARVLEWRSAMGTEERSAYLRDVAARLREARPTQYLDFAPEGGDALAPPALRRAVRESYARRVAGEPRRDTTVPLSDLSPELRERVGQSLRRLASGENPRRPRGSDVNVYPTAKLFFLAPGVAQPLPSFHTLSALDLAPATATAAPAPPAVRDPLPVPPAPGRRAALLLRPVTPEEAGRVIADAKRRGFAEVWVDCPEEGAPEMLAAAVAAGRREGVSVRAAVSLLRTRRGEDAAPAAWRDRGQSGETWPAWRERRYGGIGADAESSPRSRQAEREAGDWLRCDRPEVRALLARRLREIAAVPGLAGIALRDTAARGYAVSGRIDNYSTDALSGWSGGYVPALRAGLVRSAGIDPIDLDDSYGDFLPLSFFPTRAVRPRYHDTGEPLPAGQGVGTRLVRVADARTPRQEWQALRRAANLRLMADLFAALKTTAPDLPLCVAEQTRERWYADWTAADAVPNGEYGPSGEATLAGAGPSALAVIPVTPRFLEDRVGGVPAADDPLGRTGFLRVAVFSGWGLTMPELDALTRPDPPLPPARYLTNYLRRSADAARGRGVVLDLSRMTVDEAGTLLDVGLAAPPAGAGG